MPKRVIKEKKGVRIVLRDDIANNVITINKNQVEEFRNLLNEIIEQERKSIKL